MKIRSLLMVALAACGGGSAADPDAGEIPDAGPPDAFVPDADPTGEVSITVLAAEIPVPGIDIVWSDVDGAVVSHEQTDATGTATEVLYPGSSVTIAVSPGADQYATIVYGGVQPGDRLVFDFEDIAPTDAGDFSVTLPPGIPTGAVSYRVDLGCAVFETVTPAVPVTGDVPSDCLGGDQTIDVFVTAFDVDGNPVAWDFAKDTPVVAKTPAAIVLDEWQTAFDPLTITLTGAPATAAGAGMEAQWQADLVDFDGFGGGSGPPDNGTMVLQSGLPQGGFVEQLRYLVFVPIGTIQGADGFHILIVGHNGVPAAPTHNLGQLLLPSMSAAATADASGQVELDWTADGSFADSDGALVIAPWTDGAAQHQLIAVIPPDAPDPYAFPALPEALAAYRSSGTAAFDVPTVIFMEGDFIDGYDEFRDGAGFSLLGEGGTAILPAIGGVVRASIGGQLPGG